MAKKTIREMTNKEKRDAYKTWDFSQRGYRTWVAWVLYNLPDEPFAV